jgi:hypothetical protein
MLYISISTKTKLGIVKNLPDAKGVDIIEYNINRKFEKTKGL